VGGHDDEIGIDVNSRLQDSLIDIAVADHMLDADPIGHVGITESLELRHGLFDGFLFVVFGKITADDTHAETGDHGDYMEIATRSLA